VFLYPKYLCSEFFLLTSRPSLLRNVSRKMSRRQVNPWICTMSRYEYSTKTSHLLPFKINQCSYHVNRSYFFRFDLTLPFFVLKMYCSLVGSILLGVLSPQLAPFGDCNQLLICLQENRFRCLSGSTEIVHCTMFLVLVGSLPVLSSVKDVHTCEGRNQTNRPRLSYLSLWLYINKNVRHSLRTFKLLEAPRCPLGLVLLLLNYLTKKKYPRFENYEFV